ncbi:MAG: NADAR domain-containing protein [Saprospiraceae bacterium]
MRKNRIDSFISSSIELDYLNNRINFENGIKEKILINIAKSKDSIFYKQKYGIFGLENWEHHFTITGSLKVKSLESLGPTAIFFYNKDRYFKVDQNNNSEYILRGPRYISVIDPNLSLSQVLNIFATDIKDGIDILLKIEHDSINQYFIYFPLLDYIKNALVTIFNSFIHREKLATDEINNTEYVRIKNELLNVVSLSIKCYYLSLLNKLLVTDVLELIRKLNSAFVNLVLNKILTEYKEFKLSSKTMVRPEASNPLIMLSFAFNLVQKYHDIRCIYGLPAGGTELSILVYEMYKHFNNNNIVLSLIPISLHSLKNNFTHMTPKSQKNLKSYIPKIKLNKNILNTVIVDDNSATGSTISKTYKLIKAYSKNSNIVCAVAEADIVRSAIRIKEGKNVKIAKPVVFENSVGILPISKLIQPKVDLKEVIENKLLARHYLDNHPKSNLVQKIKCEVIIDAIENKYEYISNNLNESNSINSFKHTEYSNFYSVPIKYKGLEYPSVEHAYLSQKFDINELSDLSFTQKNDLNKIFKIKGINKELSDFSSFFYNDNYPAGVAKRVSNKLKSWGLQDKEWDNKRLEIMIELLLIKFKNSELNNLLTSTDKYLIEGNDWNDTFWGVCGKNGKNFLGRILMNIRTKYKNNEI